MPVYSGIEGQVNIGGGVVTPAQAAGAEIMPRSVYGQTNWGGEWENTQGDPTTGFPSSREMLMRGIRREFWKGTRTTIYPPSYGSVRTSSTTLLAGTPEQNYYHIMSNTLGRGRLVVSPAAHGATGRIPFNFRYRNPGLGGRMGQFQSNFGGRTGIGGLPIGPTPRVRPTKNQWTYTAPGWLRAEVASYVGLSEVPGGSTGVQEVTVSHPTGEYPTLTVESRQGDDQETQSPQPGTVTAPTTMHQVDQGGSGMSTEFWLP